MIVDQRGPRSRVGGIVPRSGGERFELHRVDAATWIIRDLSVARTDPRHLVACVSEPAEQGVEVIWMMDTPLPVSYLTPDLVLEDFCRWAGHTGHERRPVPVPHMAPRHPERC